LINPKSRPIHLKTNEIKAMIQIFKRVSETLYGKKEGFLTEAGQVIDAGRKKLPRFWGGLY
jgi:hypothetical protein